MFYVYIYLENISWGSTLSRDHNRHWENIVYKTDFALKLLKDNRTHGFSLFRDFALLSSQKMQVHHQRESSAFELVSQPINIARRKRDLDPTAEITQLSQKVSFAAPTPPLPFTNCFEPSRLHSPVPFPLFDLYY